MTPDTARSYWAIESGHGEVREEPLAAPRPGQALIRTLHSGISRGTEAIVHSARVPEAVRATMRAPHQEGDWPGPVKYGYLSVGLVEDGPPNLVGQTVFCLYPHQDRYVVAADELTVVPPGVPPHRAVLAGTMETAINAMWDAAPAYGDRVAVVGAGMVGASVAGLLRRFPLDRLQLVDVNPDRAQLASQLGVDFAAPQQADPGCDVVFHCSAAAGGLTTALGLLANGGEVIEMSWYGDRLVEVPLGEAFHSRRLTIKASQVGEVAPLRRGRRTHSDRRALALEELRDDRFEHLITGRSPFADVVTTIRRVCATDSTELCHVLDY